MVQQLSVQAAVSGDPETLMQANALDPLTASMLTLREIRSMTSEMLEKQRKWLPQYEGKSVRDVPTISIPRDVKRQAVPADPALAIANRFNRLAQV